MRKRMRFEKFTLTKDGKRFPVWITQDEHGKEIKVQVFDENENRVTAFRIDAIDDLIRLFMERTDIGVYWRKNVLDTSTPRSAESRSKADFHPHLSPNQ